MNKKQRVLFDSSVPFIVTSSLFTLPKAYPNTITPSLHQRLTYIQTVPYQRLMLLYPIRCLPLDIHEKRKFP
jgi:hypothetical protein